MEERCRIGGLEGLKRWCRIFVHVGRGVGLKGWMKRRRIVGIEG
jgi:hypothetical protein